MAKFINTIEPIQIIILLSGHGSTLQAFIDAINKKTLHAKILAVISDKADAYGLQRATFAGVKTHVLLKENYAKQASYDIALADLIKSYNPDLVILAGFMRVLSPAFVLQFYDRLINIHPSLLPDYKGINTHQRVLADGKKQHGTTVHFVIPELDSGPIIAQEYLTVLPTDTLDSLKARVQEIEHQLYPRVVQLFAEKRVKLTTEGVVIDGKIV